MIRKALLVSFAMSVSLLVPVNSSAANSVNICVAYDLGGPGDRSYNDAVLAGLSANKKIKITIKSATSGLAEMTKSLMAAGNDVIFIAIVGSDNEIFSEVSKYNVSKKKSAAEVGVITIEPDQYLTVTAKSQKYLLGAISKRVDNAVYDLVFSAINDQLILNVLDSDQGIYGRRYGISGGNIEFLIWAPKLQAIKNSIHASSRIAAKL